MNKPLFVFTQNQNSFSVHVENLEELLVEQIKIIEKFVSQRNGIFDFKNYTFVIQKKLELYEFISLLKYSNIDANVKERILKIKTSEKIEFGKYKGMFYSELPDSYLLWLKKNYRVSQRDIIDREINNRSL